jgi:hypothetical protein
MWLLSDWSHEQSRKTHVLPTVSSEVRSTAFLNKSDAKVIPAGLLGGIVDAMQLGQWIGGEDPRNIPISRKPTNRHAEVGAIEILSFAELGELRFELGQDETLNVQFKDGSRTNVYNLHFHSKIHSWLLKSDRNLPKLIEYVNRTQFITLPTTRRTQIIYFLEMATRSILRSPASVIRRWVRAISNLFR